MKKLLPLLFSALCLPALANDVEPRLPPVELDKLVHDNVAALQERAMKDPRAYDIVASLTTEVGPRLAGTAGDRAAVAWAMAKLRELGFKNVRAESVEVPHWERGTLEAEILSPFPQELVAVSLGGSMGTPEEGISAPMLMVESLDELTNMKPKEV